MAHPLIRSLSTLSGSNCGGRKPTRTQAKLSEQILRHRATLVRGERSYLCVQNKRLFPGFNFFIPHLLTMDDNYNFH